MKSIAILALAAAALSGCMRVEPDKQGSGSPNAVGVIGRTPEGCTVYVIAGSGVSYKAIVCPAGYSGGIAG